MSIRVKALVPGHFGHYRGRGDVFTIPGIEQRGRWMQPIDAEGNVIDWPSPEPVEPEPVGDPPVEITGEAIAEALAKLDPEKDEDWTQDGKPAMKAVEALLGTDKVSRKDLPADFNREAAKAAKAEV